MPTMLYRLQDEPNPEVWNAPLAYSVVEDDQIDASVAQGWALDGPALLAEPKAPKKGKAAAEGQSQ